MASTNASTAAAPQDDFAFTVKWNVPDSLKNPDGAELKLWPDEVINLPHTASINDLRKQIEDLIDDQLCLHDQYPLSNLPSFMQYLAQIHDPNSPEPCRMIRYFISLTASGGSSNGPGITFELDVGMWKRFEKICDLTASPDELKQMQLRVDVQLGIETCYRGTTLQPNDRLNRFIRPNGAPFEYVKIGTVQPDDVKKVNLLKTPQGEVPERKNVIVFRFNQTKKNVKDAQDFEDEIRLVNAWRFGTTGAYFLIGNCGDRRRMDWASFIASNIKVTKTYQLGNGKNPGLQELKRRVFADTNEERKTAPKLPFLTMHSFNQNNNTQLNPGELCKVIIRVVYILPNGLQLNALERRCPQNMSISINNTTTVANVETLMYASSRSSTEPLNQIANGRNLANTRCKWWIMPGGNSMKTMHQIDQNHRPVRFIDPARTGGGEVLLYMECHIRENGAPPNTYTQQGT